MYVPAQCLRGPWGLFLSCNMKMASCQPEKTGPRSLEDMYVGRGGGWTLCIYHAYDKELFVRACLSDAHGELYIINFAASQVMCTGSLCFPVNENSLW